MQVTLSVTRGPHLGRVFTFHEHDNFIVGRARCAHFRLPLKDKYFSRVHFMVEVNPPRCRLMDMGSTNGTRVNGRKVRTADLKDGDRIKGGETVIHVAIQEGVDSTLLETGGHDSSQPASEHAIAAAAQDDGGPSPRPPAPGCPICGNPGTAADGAPLCLVCAQQVRNQPQPIAGYQIVRELGRGGMGVVSLALREADGMPVALKTIVPAIVPSEKDVARFVREANIVRALDHPRIVACRDVGQAHGQIYFAMEYVPGIDAACLLKNEGGPLPTGRAVAIACQLLDALEYAHARKFVHRDIKPANLLLMRIENRDVVKLADFGLARIYQASRLSGLTMTGESSGTPAFMAPEQITHYRDAMPATDLYAVGATLYNLLTDRYIYDFPGRLELKLLKILQDDPVPIQARRAEIPKDLAAVIHRALAREPGDRFADARAMRAALRP
jgi:serine/threonine-protein kinase